LLHSFASFGVPYVLNALALIDFISLTYHLLTQRSLLTISHIITDEAPHILCSQFSVLGCQHAKSVQLHYISAPGARLPETLAGT